MLTDEEFYEFLDFLQTSEWFGAGHLTGVYEFSDELIQAIISQNEEKVLEFCYPETLVKGTKFYTPEWVYYATIDDYKEAGITPSDIAQKLPLYYSIERLERQYIDDLALAALEQKVYLYAKEIGDTECLDKICDYDRDFDMPLPYFRTKKDYNNPDTKPFQSWGELSWKVGLFKNMKYEYLDQDGNVCFEDGYYVQGLFENPDELVIQKGDKRYTMQWVYYNTAKAYKEAGITKTELARMLPKYSSICLLSEEALNALKNKIDSYDFEDEISNAETFTPIPGDIQATGEVELSDVIYLKKSFLDFPEYKLSIAISDMNGDEKFDLNDVIALKKAFLGISESGV